MFLARREVSAGQPRTDAGASGPLAVPRLYCFRSFSRVPPLLSGDPTMPQLAPSLPPGYFATEHLARIASVNPKFIYAMGSMFPKELTLQDHQFGPAGTVHHALRLRVLAVLLDYRHLSRIY